LKNLAIIASAHLGQLIAHHAQNAKLYNVVGFFDDFKTKNDVVDGYPILGGTKDIQEVFSQNIFDEIMIAVGYKHLQFRMNIFDFCKQNNIPVGKVIHPSSYIDSSCKIGDGAFILPGCVLDMNVVLHENVLLNTACTIAHDSTVGAHTFLSPRVAVAGFVNIGSCCNIGINTTIIDNITLAANTQTGGGTIVIKNIEKAGLYVGNPQRFIR